MFQEYSKVTCSGLHDHENTQPATCHSNDTCEKEQSFAGILTDTVSIHFVAGGCIDPEALQEEVNWHDMAFMPHNAQEH